MAGWAASNTQARVATPATIQIDPLENDKRKATADAALCRLLLRFLSGLTPGEGCVVTSRRDYPGNAQFDGWLKANAAVGSIVAIAVLAMAVAGLQLRLASLAFSLV
jgi:hypothetical protein